MEDSEAFEYKTLITKSKYYITRRIGGGNFGDVYLAEQKVGDKFVRKVAIKITKSPPSGTLDVPFAELNPEEILKDAIGLAQVFDASHDSEGKRYLPIIYDMGILDNAEINGVNVKDADKRGYIVMEYISGTTLLGHLNSQSEFKFPAITVKRYAKQLCKGLRVLHDLLEEAPVIHQDIKPSNILLTDADEIRIVDFGLAVRLSKIFNWRFGVAGTVTYMASETLVGRSSLASDIYSFGLTLYEMLTGIHPFAQIRDLPDVELNLLPEDKRQEKNLLHHYKKRQELHIRSPYELNNTVDKRMSDVIMRCLVFHDDPKPRDNKPPRYQSATELLEAIEGLDRDEIDPREKFYNQGIEALQDGRLDEAIRCFIQVLSMSRQKEDGLKLNATWELGKTYEKKEDFSKAIDYLHEVENLDKRYGFLKRKKQIQLYKEIEADYKKIGQFPAAEEYKEKWENMM